jgi:hypothetical protein
MSATKIENSPKTGSLNIPISKDLRMRLKLLAIESDQSLRDYVTQVLTAAAGRTGDAVIKSPSPSRSKTR